MAELFDSLPVGIVLRTFVQYLIAFCSQPETASEVISCSFVRLPLSPTSVYNFCDSRLKRFREIRPEVIGRGILQFVYDNFQSEEASDFVSGVAAEWVGLEVYVKFGDSTSNGS